MITIDELYKDLKVLEERVRGSEKALELKDKADSIHFTALNGEAGKLHNMQLTYIPREVFEGFVKEYRIQREEEVEKYNNLVLELKSKVSYWILWTSITGAVGAGVGLAQLFI